MSRMNKSRSPSIPANRTNRAPQKGRPRGIQRRASRPGATSAKPRGFEIPRGVSETEIDVDGGRVHLTNLEKIFWPELELTKRDLLQYYLDVSPWLLPHLKDRAMVMKR